MIYFGVLFWKSPVF